MNKLQFLVLINDIVCMGVDLCKNVGGSKQSAFVV